LALDDRIGDRLPKGVVEPDAARNVTIEDLLRHTGGFGDFYDGVTPDNRIHEKREIMSLIHLVGLPLRQETSPGTWAYSNIGYLLLGAVLEDHTGRPFREIIARQIFDPAGMARAGYGLHDDVDDDAAIGYMPMPADEALLDARRFWPGHGTPAGGAYLSADDLFRFCNALSRGKMISPESFEAMRTPAAAQTTAWECSSALAEASSGRREDTPAALKVSAQSPRCIPSPGSSSSSSRTDPWSH